MAESLCKMVEAQITQVLALVSKWTKYYQATLLRVIRKIWIKIQKMPPSPMQVQEVEFEPTNIQKCINATKMYLL